jgi:spoIIIJ-associated protein
VNDAKQFAKQFLEDLLSFFGLNVSVDVSEEDEVIELGIPSTTMNGFLIGEHGGNLRSMQHLISLALMKAGLPHRVNLDVADYKKQRAERLSEQVRQWAAAVAKTGTPMELVSMSAADRRTVHKTVGEIEGLVSESAGEGRDRHVVIRPSAGN